MLPRTLGEVLAFATGILTRVWRPLGISALIAFIPAGVVSALTFRWLRADEFLQLVLGDPAGVRNLPADVILELSRPFLTAVLIGLVVQGIAAVYVFLVSHRVATVEMSGATATGTEARRFAARRAAKAFLAVALGAVPAIAVLAAGFTIWSVPASAGGSTSLTAAFVGTVLLGVFLAPGLWLATSFSMVVGVVATESMSPVRALSRSTQLVSGRRLATLGFLALVGLAGLVATQLIQIVAVPLSTVAGADAFSWLVAAAGIAAQGLIVAAIGVMLAVWYVDLRSRQETVLSENLI